MKSKMRWMNFCALSFGVMLLVTIARGQSVGPQTVDSVIAGGEQNERDHNLKGEQTETQQLNNHTYRVAGTNGWFSWQLKVLPDVPRELDIEFGGERRRPADAVDIFADETKLATVRLAGGPSLNISHFAQNADRTERRFATGFGRTNAPSRLQAGAPCP